MLGEKIGEALTYCADEPLVPGQIVLVPLMRRLVAAVVVKKVAQPDFKCRKVVKILYSKPLPRHLMKTAEFMQNYYMVPAGSVIGMFLPKGIEKKRRKNPLQRDEKTGGKRFFKGDEVLGEDKSVENSVLAKNNTILLNPYQKNALEGLQQAPGATKLLHGVTGSGKTNIYLKMALDALERHQSTILLVPEIALTGQLVRVFQEVFGDKVAMIHSKQTGAERHLVFDDLLFSEEPRIVIGPRSALFAPLGDLGLIIIDEEHENTYYQENSPKYSAIRVASFMAKTLGISCILGSATPTIEDYYIAREHRALVTLREKAKESANLPKIEIIDLKNRKDFTKNRYFSNSLIQAMQRNLDSGVQTLIFHNRRGSAPLTICEKCGEELLCPNCFLPLTLHADRYELVCHTCDFHEKVPATCPNCGHPDLIHKGFGTKLLENEVRKILPKARVMRFDADNKKGEGLSEVYSEVRDGEVDVLVGTQTLAKGLDLPKLATVGVVQADAGLMLPDFAAEEKVFQLVTQVIGRVGRGHLERAEVFIQTFRPEHPVLCYAKEADYEGFFEYMLKRRRQSGFPPYRHLMKVELTLKTEALVIKKIQEIATRMAQNEKLMVSPPMPAFHERTNRGYTWGVIVRATSRKALTEVALGLDKSFRVTLDPPSLL